jgi:prepilin-type N-terminal cleavage/methylation domain-containing protein
MKNNQGGFSLIEVMIAAGLIGVVAFAVVRMNEQIIRSEIRMLDLMDMMDMMNEVRTEMVSYNSCFFTFENIKPTNKKNQPITLPKNLEVLMNKNGDPLIEVGEKYGRLKISEIRIMPSSKEFEEDSFDLKQGKISIFFEMTGNIKAGSRKTGKVRLPIFASKKAGQDMIIHSCSQAGTDLVDQVTEKVMMNMCAGMGVGYNDMTKSCDFGSLMQNNGANETYNEGLFKQPQSNNSQSPPSSNTQSNNTENTKAQKQLEDQLKDLNINQGELMKAIEEAMGQSL